MKLHIQGKGPIDLTQKDFLTQGGEGAIYVRGTTAFKVYNDPKKMIAPAKIQELAVLTHPGIVKPEELLLDNKDKPVGYTMPYVRDTYALCQLFTKAFRDRNKVTPDQALGLVRQLQELVKHVHDNKILIVDLNELNFLTSNNFKALFAIDVDSYQTPNFRATALMESVRDRHTKGFSEVTDWFAFAIVSFQLFVGIHPYKGKHPKLKTMDERMMKNISVLNKDVGIPSVCYPLTVIPQSYLDWYQAVLERGDRVPPPSDLQGVAHLVQTIKRLVGSNNFDIQEFGEFDGPIMEIIFAGGYQFTLTDKTIFMGKDKTAAVPNCSIVTTPKFNTVIAGAIEYRKLKLYNATVRLPVMTAIEADGLMTYDNRMYVKSGSHIVEIQFSNESVGGKDLVALTRNVANVLERATKMFDGVAFQSLLGSCWVSLFPEAESHIQIRIAELDDYKILDAKFDHGVLMVVGAAKTGTYDKFIFRVEDSSYDVRVVKDINPAGLNFVVLDSGICVHLTEDDNIEIFSKKKGSVGLNIIDDSEIHGDMKLFKMGTKVLVAKGDKLYSMTMKKKP